MQKLKVRRGTVYTVPSVLFGPGHKLFQIYYIIPYRYPGADAEGVCCLSGERKLFPCLTLPTILTLPIARLIAFLPSLPLSLTYSELLNHMQTRLTSQRHCKAMMLGRIACPT